MAYFYELEGNYVADVLTKMSIPIENSKQIKNHS